MWNRSSPLCNSLVVKHRIIIPYDQTMTHHTTRMTRSWIHRVLLLSWSRVFLGNLSWTEMLQDEQLMSLGHVLLSDAQNKQRSSPDVQTVPSLGGLTVRCGGAEPAGRPLSLPGCPLPARQLAARHMLNTSLFTFSQKSNSSPNVFQLLKADTKGGLL